jgi:hypothetical protein
MLRPVRVPALCALRACCYKELCTRVFFSRDGADMVKKVSAPKVVRPAAGGCSADLVYWLFVLAIAVVGTSCVLPAIRVAFALPGVVVTEMGNLVRPLAPVPPPAVRSTQPPVAMVVPEPIGLAPAALMEAHATDGLSNEDGVYAAF